MGMSGTRDWDRYGSKEATKGSVVLIKTHQCSRCAIGAMGSGENGVVIDQRACTEMRRHSTDEENDEGDPLEALGVGVRLTKLHRQRRSRHSQQHRAKPRLVPNRGTTIGREGAMGGEATRNHENLRPALSRRLAGVLGQRLQINRVHREMPCRPSGRATACRQDG